MFKEKDKQLTGGKYDKKNKMSKQEYKVHSRISEFTQEFKKDN